MDVVTAPIDFVTSLFTPPKPPKPQKQPQMPTVDDQAMRKAEMKKLQQMKARKGRASTMLSDAESLG